MISFGTLGVGYATWSENVTINQTATTTYWERGGTYGFWKNWDRHETYNATQIEQWLVSINATSQWLVPDIAGDGIDIGDMEAVFASCVGSEQDPEYKWQAHFLCHYLATRLNVEAGRLSTEPTRDFTGYDPDDYLGLGQLGTLEEIIWGREDSMGTVIPGTGIEGKCPPTPEPTDKQFELMKTICDALNNVKL